ncbi:MAG TPA: response regulator [Thermodesulfovibrionales bacterium]|nr:response regulator [Thermodesulfovibrionales bacterium]
MGHKLLLSDDSITIQKVVELVLAGEGFDIKATNNGDEALAALQSFRPDVVLADIAMPVMNGYQLCEKIKKNPDTADIPVILLAGAFEPIDEDLAKDVGSDDYIIKPFESQELLSKVNAVLVSKGMEEEEPMEGEALEAADMEAAEEDLWTMEEITAAPTEEGLSAEPPMGEKTAFEEPVEVAEEFGAGRGIEKIEAEEVAGGQRVAPPATPQIEFPSRDEFADILKKTLDEKVASLIRVVDIQESLLAAITPSVKDSAEKVLWEVAPQLIERLLKEMLQGVLASLTKEIEKVIWDTVPELAETMISKEIEKIKSEI